MNDWVDAFSEYRRIKDISDVLDDTEKLRSLYYELRFEEMHRHIKMIMLKYPKEILLWNAVNSVAPRNEDEAFRAADEFLISVVVMNVGKKIEGI